MKLTPNDIEVFRHLAHADSGRYFIDYLDRVCDEICDSRNWKEGDTAESTRKAAEYIKKNIRDRIALASKPISATPEGDHQYE